MAGLLDGLDLSGLVGDDKTKDEFGQTQADRRAPLWSGLINAGLLAVAGGGNLMPAERAKYIAQAGGALGGIGTDMIQARSAAAQQALRGQEIKGKQIDLAQSQKWREYADSPEFQAAMDQAKASPAERMAAKAAAMKGDFGSVTKILDPKRNHTKYNPDGSRELSDGSVIDGFGQMVVGPGGVFIPPNQRTGTTPTSTTPQPPVVPPGANSPDINVRTRTADEEITGFQKYGTPDQPKPAPTPQAALFAPSKFTSLDMSALKQIADQHGPQVAQQVRDFAEYKNPFPISARTGAITNPGSTTAQMLAMVKQVNPDWTSADFDNRKKMTTEYLISGKAKNNIDALNTAYGHIGDLYDTFKALSTGDSQLMNAAMNALSEKMGGAKIVDAKTAAEAVAHELSSVFRAQGMSVAEIDEWKKQISPNMSPAQMQAVIERITHLMQARVDTHTKDWKNVMGNTPVQFFNPDRIKKIEEIHANPIGGKPAAAAPAPTNLPTVSTKEGYDALAPGAAFIGSDGKQYTKPE